MSEDTCHPPGHRTTAITRLLAAAAVVLLAAATLAPSSAAALTAPSGWTVVTTPQSGSSDSSLLMGTTCAGSWSCWAVGGAFPSLNNGQPHAIVDRWDGSAWVAVGGVDPPDSGASLLFAVTCTAATDCWAVGAEQSSAGGPQPLTEHWNGSSWSVVPVPTDGGGYLLSVSCVSTTDCWGVGTSIETVDSNQNPLHAIIDHWDGTSWTSVAPAVDGQPYDGLQGVTCLSAADCWAVGYAGPQDVQWNLLPGIAPEAPEAQPLAEHWDGQSWSVAPVDGAGTSALLDAVTCSGSSCWAAGATLDAAGNPEAGLALRWTGSAWVAETTPDPSTGGDLLTGLACTSPSACWATGAQQASIGNNNGSAPQPYVEAWNGSSWSVQPSPDVMAFGYPTGVACVRASGCVISGFAASNLGGNNQVNLSALIEQLQLPAGATQGLWLASANGGVFALGVAPFDGSAGGLPLTAPMVGMAADPDGTGYWLAAHDGGVFSFGSAGFHGSAGGLPLTAPVVGMAPTPDGKGYWLVAADGGVFSYGDAGFFGSAGGLPLTAPVVGMAPTPDGKGYWLVAADGGVFAYGDAVFHGSAGGVGLGRPVVGLTATPDGGGYWLVAADGGVFTYGDAPYDGSVPGQGIRAAAPATGLVVTPDGGGYWITGADGAVYTYGDATFLGSMVGRGLTGPVVAAAGS